MTAVRAVLVPPGDPPRAVDLDPSIETLEELVGGKVEPLLIDDGVILWSCGDARLYDVPPNRAKQLGGWTVRGPFVLTRASGASMAPLTAEDVTRYLEHFGPGAGNGT